MEVKEKYCQNEHLTLTIEFHMMLCLPHFVDLTHIITCPHFDQWCGWGSFHETETNTEVDAALARPRRGSWQSGRGEAEARLSENHVNDFFFFF